ncbi:E3 ubiquitin-protein ligase MGRN1-like isoform X1 [Amphibalanus amphitrite]|uniref:E3 ubiquitin-protein ligase MGRN1-like isoform X1 n=1 Tax=Amphibalanus amphitrite TaxID=1232801 RepID=UPI001C9057B8|nr:E3 ubiquitin-protein ligase MGRN1-like isoform X1 [Amphibalanus amphitrite]XP_043206634.1 E3 ubiquitin-protein ligase MGRN1-like isoform X1 [Amphibalanus amphitrite]XP_043206635.1 E3 ubiquitin-protein ligase MGRN1-like isoform X1 [Amphibalanus amphitrite]
MGSLTSRQEGTTEELDAEHVHSYKYPPKSGNYFGTHFIMGGEKFETPQPEAYLFGENSDLNFLSSKPAQSPYALPPPNEPSKTLKSVVNIRKDSLRLVRLPTEADSPAGRQKFNIEFTFDSDVRCTITVHYFCTEEMTRHGLMYRPRDPGMSSETYSYKCGAAQTFCQPDHTFEPGLYSDAELSYNSDSELYPVVVVCTSEEGEEPHQCHVTTGVVDRLSDGSFMLKPLKQKQYIDGLVFLLQEIYGIENKLVDNKSVDEDTEDSGAECVICMSDLRDTLILPCRHLCVCNCCADHLRYQANNCPICRAPFRALLQLRAVQRTVPGAPAPPATEGSDGIPAGYEPVTLVEALNGPISTGRDAAGSPPLPRPTSGPLRSRGGVKRQPSAVSDRSSRDSLHTVSSAAVPPEVRRRVLEERGRAELEEAAGTDGTAAVHRSRTPSREKGKREDGAGDDTEECERRSLLESPPPAPPRSPPQSLTEPRSATLGRKPSAASSTDSETSAAVRNSRLVTVIPIEHETHLQLEDYQDTEDEIIEDQCRPGHLAPPNTADTGDSDPSKRLGSYQPSSVVGPRPAEVQLLASESPASRSSRGSLSSGGSTRLLIPGASRETDM